MLALFLASPAAAAPWHQVGGDAGHAGVAALGTGPLDVVGSFRFTAEGVERINCCAAGLAESPHGILGVVETTFGAGRACQLFRIREPATGVVDRVGPPVQCDDGGRLLAYDAVHDQVLVSIDGRPTDMILQAWDAASGEVRWGVSIDQPVEAPGAADRNDWFIDGFAIAPDGTIGYAAFSSDLGRNRIMAIALEDGAIVWASSVPLAAFVTAPAVDGVTDTAGAVARGSLGQSAHAFNIDQLTLTDTGLVVRGTIHVNGAHSIAWLDLHGNTVGTATRTASATSPALRSSANAAGLGARAAAVLGTDLIIVDPVNTAPLVTPVPVEFQGFGSLAPPAWSREALVAPLGRQLAIFPAADTGQMRVWPAYEGSWIDRVIIAPPGDAYALVVRTTRDGDQASLLRIDLATARTVGHVPLPWTHDEIGGTRAYLLPLVNGHLLAWSNTGAAVLLGAAEPSLRPAVELATQFPAAGETLSLTATADPAAQTTVAWGDGVLDLVPSGAPVVHEYDSPGRRVIRVTAVHPDGRTGTSEVIVFVGAAPPQKLTPIQHAFSPERQELTFFLLGLAVTGLGAALALRRRYRRKSRLQVDLEEIERLRALGRLDPAAAVRELATYRQRLKKDLSDGALDDAHFTALSGEATRLLDALRARVFAALEGDLSPRFRHLLEVALEDGAVTAQEASRLREALAAETRLGETDRQRIAALLDGGPSGA